MARILVVDDSKFMRLTLKSILEKDGQHQVIGEAENDSNAVIRYQEQRPDLVTMDIVMPVESGMKAVREIVQIDDQAKIIMISAMGQEKIVEEAMQLGAKAFVCKPVKADDLLATVRKVLE